MDRRRFLCLPVAAALLPTRANAGAADGKRRLAFFSWRSTCGPDSLQESILPALRAAGWTEGHNLSIERHCAFADNDAAPALANALARSGADVAVVWGAFSVGPLRRATTSIPIAAFVDDAVAEGLADEYRKPRGNVTGLCLRHPEWERKSIEHFRRVVPQLKRLAIVGEGPPESRPGTLMAGVDAAAREAGIGTVVKKAPLEDFERVFAELARDGIRAAYIWTRRIDRIGSAAELATRAKIATLTLYPEGVKGGALMGYMVVNSREEARMAAIIDKILRGMRPALIPWELPDEPVLSINLQTAKRLGLAIPADVLIRATEVIQ